MEKRLFSIVLSNGESIRNSTVTTDSLRKIIDDFIDTNGHCICITRASSETEKIEIQKYYKSQYYFFNRKYKSKQITEKEYTQAMNKLKEIKKESETLEEIKTKFNKYKKTLTIIPPYNVSGE